MNKLIDFLINNKKLLKILLIFLMAAFVALLALNNKNLMPFIYMIF